MTPRIDISTVPGELRSLLRTVTPCYHGLRLVGFGFTNSISRHAKDFAARTRFCMTAPGALAMPNKRSNSTACSKRSHPSGNGFGTAERLIISCVVNKIRPMRSAKKRNQTAARGKSVMNFAEQWSLKVAEDACQALAALLPQPQRAATLIAISVAAADPHQTPKNTLNSKTYRRTS